jgi:hypothetical protein
MCPQPIAALPVLPLRSDQRAKHKCSGEANERGTSRRDDALDTVIALRRPADYSPEEGARFEVHIEKARTLAGEGAIPFEASRRDVRYR